MATIEQDVVQHHENEFPPVLEITEGASLRLQSMMKERNLEGYGLRVFVSGGGCSGLQYGMTFDNEERFGDTVWNAHGLRIMVDPISARYLMGATISYQQDNMLAGTANIYALLYAAVVPRPYYRSGQSKTRPGGAVSLH
jgi:iron-sulfur cluster assembly protein